MADLEETRELLKSRFAPGWAPVLAVPDTWLPHLARLDAALAGVDPHYRLAQVKTKYGSLRYYLDDPLVLSCCAQLEAAHPYPADADDAAIAAFEEAVEAHEDSAGHQRAQAEREDRETRMEQLIRAAEVASTRW